MALAASFANSVQGRIIALLVFIAFPGLTIPYVIIFSAILVSDGPAAHRPFQFTSVHARIFSDVMSAVGRIVAPMAELGTSGLVIGGFKLRSTFAAFVVHLLACDTVVVQVITAFKASRTVFVQAVSVFTKCTHGCRAALGAVGHFISAGNACIVF